MSKPEKENETSTEEMLDKLIAEQQPDKKIDGAKMLGTVIILAALFWVAALVMIF